MIAGLVVLVYIAAAITMMGLCSYLYVARGWFMSWGDIDYFAMGAAAIFWPIAAVLLVGALVSELVIARAKRLKDEKRLAKIEMDRAMREVEHLMRTEVR